MSFVHGMVNEANRHLTLHLEEGRLKHVYSDAQLNRRKVEERKGMACFLLSLARQIERLWQEPDNMLRTYHPAVKPKHAKPEKGIKTDAAPHKTSVVGYHG